MVNCTKCPLFVLGRNSNIIGKLGNFIKFYGKIPDIFVLITGHFGLFKTPTLRFGEAGKTQTPSQIQRLRIAKTDFKSVRKTINCLPIVMKMLDDFTITNPSKYFSDLETFFSEAKFEDFYEAGKDVITISTIHKAKGHEYDNVYMLMNGQSIPTDENKRKIFVGITRAKNNLSIHYNDDIFKQFNNLTYIEECSDENLYNEPNNIILQLSHKDVYLNYFKYKQNIILKLRSGDKLQLSEDGLSVNLNNKKTDILKYSTSCKKKIESLLSQGYKISEANIRFIVYWQEQNEETEIAIILPDVKFSRL